MSPGHPYGRIFEHTHHILNGILVRNRLTRLVDAAGWLPHLEGIEAVWMGAALIAGAGVNTPDAIAAVMQNTARRPKTVVTTADGRVSERTAYFATVKPRKELETYISPLDGQNVGVGMPVVVRFSSPVKNRAAVEQALTVDTSKPIIGSWSWTSDEEVHFRPKKYWPAYTDVKVKVDLAGVDAVRQLITFFDRSMSRELAGAGTAGNPELRARGGRRDPEGPVRRPTRPARSGRGRAP